MSSAACIFLVLQNSVVLTCRSLETSGTETVPAQLICWEAACMLQARDMQMFSGMQGPEHPLNGSIV